MSNRSSDWMNMSPVSGNDGRTPLPGTANRHSTTSMETMNR